MTDDQISIVLVTAAWSGAVGLVGLVVAWFVRRRSLRMLTAVVALVAVLAVVAGTVGTSRAMFLSDHDFGVVLLVQLVAGLVGLAARSGTRRAGSVTAGASSPGECCRPSCATSPMSWS